MSKQLNFTPSAIESLRVGRITDSRTPGLFVDVGATGKRTFRFSRRVKGSTRIYRDTLGTHPAHTIVEAREWANAINLQIDRGIDPASERREAEKRQMTVAEAHAIYFAAVERGLHNGKQRMIKPRSLSDKKGIWTRDIEPKIGATPLASVDSDMLWDMVEDKGQTAPVRANRLAGELKVFFKFCANNRAGRSIGLKADPASTLNGYYFEEKARTRVLSPAEIELFIVALAPEKRIIRRALLLMLLAATRHEETVTAQLSDFRDGIWTIGDPKNGLAHVVPLGPWGQTCFATNTDNVFPSDITDGPKMWGWYSRFDAIQARMAKAGGVEVARFRPHDLRRTFRTEMERRGMPFATVEALMNHKKQGLERHYNQFEYLAEKRAALLMWETELAEIARRLGVAEALEVPPVAAE